MTTPRQLLWLPAALALALTVNLPLFAQPGPATGGKVPDVKNPVDEKKPLENGGVVKGQLPNGVHPVKMIGGQQYIIKVKTKNFQPMTQIKDKNFQNTYTTQTNIFPNGQELMQQFAFIAPNNGGEFNIVVTPLHNNNFNGALEYTVEVKIPKTVFEVASKLTNSDPYYPLRDGCHHKVHNVELKGGTTYQINLASSNPFVYLEDALGNLQKFTTGYAPGSQVAFLIFQPSKTDLYRVIATTNNGSMTGDYTIKVMDTPLQEGIGFGPGFGPGGPGGIIINPNPVPFPINPKLPKKPLPGGGFKGGIQPGMIQPFPGGVQLQPLPAIQPGGIQLQPGVIKLQLQPAQIEIDQIVLPVVPLPDKK